MCKNRNTHSIATPGVKYQVLTFSWCHPQSSCHMEEVCVCVWVWRPVKGLFHLLYLDRQTQGSVMLISRVLGRLVRRTALGVAWTEYVQWLRNDFHGIVNAFCCFLHALIEAGIPKNLPQMNISDWCCHLHRFIVFYFVQIWFHFSLLMSAF